MSKQERWYSSPTQRFWACKALIEGREISHETEISEVMYTSQACYSRKKAIVGAETVAQYKKGTKVNIVAATDTGYYKLADGSFIHSDYDIKVNCKTRKHRSRIKKPV